MPRITYVSFEGTRQTVEISARTSIMAAARQHGVAGIAGDCGGGCACATCHVYVDELFLAKLPPAAEMELGLLDFVNDRRENSRLSCQLVMTEDLDGIVVETPESQY